MEKPDKRQNYSFFIKPSVRKKLADYVEKHGLVVSVFIERAILEKINGDEKNEQ